MKILYYYPENPLNFSQGNNARAFGLLRYFKDRQIEIDFVGEGSELFPEEQIEKLKQAQLIKNGWLLKKTKRKGVGYFLKQSLPKILKSKVKDFDRRRPGQQEKFNTILENNSYDYILISYVYWMSLVMDNPLINKAKIVLDTHDFLTSQFQGYNRFKLGKFFEQEMKIMEAAEFVLTISKEEQYLFGQFVKSDIFCIPHALESRFRSVAEKSIDILYVASKNEHNQLAAKWYFENVYPHLDPTLKTVIIGGIVKYIGDFENITKIDYIENLDSYYQRSKIVICPMLSGTGLKIKVIEALSYGIPIVCNERGIDGLINKTNNGCLVANDPLKFAHYIHELSTNKLVYTVQKEMAQDFFESHYHIAKIYDDLDQVFSPKS